MQIDSEYEISDTVYLRVREEKLRGMVTGVTIRKAGDTLCCAYEVTWPTGDSMHYSYELTDCYVPEFPQ